MTQIGKRGKRGNPILQALKYFTEPRGIFYNKRGI